MPSEPSISAASAGEGWDLYDVKRERDTARWKILLSAGNKILAANPEWTVPIR